MGYSFKDLGSDILLIEDLLDAGLCQHIVQVSESCQFAETAPILINTKDVQVRSSGYLALDLADSLHKSTNDLLLSKIFIIQDLLYQHYGIQFPHAETCSILRYAPGQAYKRHVDNLLLASRMQELQQGVPTRDISIVGYLNDNFEGGETFFDRQNLKVKPKQGSAVVFPAYYTHPHQALPVTRGRKYVFTSWLYY